ncbi:hypothetical protein F444_07466 [Phytophthora nicotianae P1976]|uniref:Ubiquitin-like protease family profile domain-containing protein n=1 Tax=Phytophthora nicotianae P1976 TaxID=1317066 RepID=A0A081AEN1_PHYNI|nr:hypothetical protein F444_07466 [Phytophthora nicotianae P1976]
MTTFYEIKRSCDWWERDLDWITQDWMKVTGRPIEFFAAQTDSDGKAAPEAKQRLTHLSSEVSAMFSSACCHTKFYHKDPTKGIFFQEVVGYVADRAWLNDAVLNYALDIITTSHLGVHVLSSFVADQRTFPSPPRAKLFSMRFVILPINIESSHWTLIVVAVHRHGTITVHMYDPLCTTGYRKRMEKIWTAKLLPYLRAWHSQWESQVARQEEHPFPADVDIEWLMSPMQPDGYSCGVMVAAMAYSFIYGGRGYTVDAVTRDVVKVMRLRLLWVILCGSHVEPIEESLQIEAKRIGKQITAAFGKGSKKIWN